MSKSQQTDRQKEVTKPLCSESLMGQNNLHIEVQFKKVGLTVSLNSLQDSDHISYWIKLTILSLKPYSWY